MRKPVSAFVAMAMAIGIGAVVGSSPGALAHPGHAISVNDVTVGENSGSATFTLTVTPTPDAGETVSVDVATAPSTAAGTTGSCPVAPDAATADYVSVPTTTITWIAGETIKVKAVTVCQDTVSEGNQTFLLNLTNAVAACTPAPCAPSSGATITDSQGVGTIVDDDQSALQIADHAVPSPEGPAGTQSFGFSVTLTPATNQAVTVQFTTAAGTADAGTDYVANSGTLTFPANSTDAQTINVTVNGDVTAETDETFFVNLFSPTNAAIADPQGLGIIQNDDGPTAGANAFTINDVTRFEGNTGSSPTTPFTFTVTLGQQPGPAHTATVNYQVTQVSATAGVDYLLVSDGTLSFGTTDTARTVTVPVVGDVSDEPNETFTVNLSLPGCTGGGCSLPTIADGQGTGTINDDDVGPTPSPTPTPTPAPGPITTTLKIGGYFQVRITAASPCAASRFFKVKKSVSGPDKVVLEGTTNSAGTFKQAVRPKKKGRFYAQAYNVTVQGKLCKAGKSLIRTLPA